MRICVTEDEKWTRFNLVRMLKTALPEAEIEECTCGSELLELAAKNSFDCFFLDIQLNDVTGITLAKALRKMHPQAHLVFATAYEEHALTAFDLGAVDYLLKPFNEERLKQCLARLKLTIPQKQLDTLVLEVGRSKTVLKVSDILYFESLLKKCIVHTTKQNYEIIGSLNHYEALFQNRFIRPHKSYLVNKQYIETIYPTENQQYCLTLKTCSDIIPVARKQVKLIKEGMGQ